MRPSLAVMVWVAACTSPAARVDAGQVIASQPTKPPTPAPLPEPEWQTRSPHALALVISRRRDQHCVVECSVSGKAAWTREECLSTSSELHFVSDDCSVFVALTDAPKVDPVTLTSSVVGSLWKPNGPPFPLVLDHFGTAAATRVSESGKWFAWLAGTFEHPGQPPRSSRDGIELDLLDQTKVRVSFSELAKWPTSAPTHVLLVVDAGIAPVPNDGQLVLYQWEGEDGVTQMGTLDQVPAKHRKHASVVKAELGEVPAGDPLPPPSRFPDSRPLTQPRVDSCQRAHDEVDRINTRIATLKPPAACDQFYVRDQFGRLMVDVPSRIRCTSAREAAENAQALERAQLQKELETAQEQLRRTQVSGCR